MGLLTALNSTTRWVAAAAVATLLLGSLAPSALRPATWFMGLGFGFGTFGGAASSVGLLPWLSLSGAITVALVLTGFLFLLTCQPPITAWRLSVPVIALVTWGIGLGLVRGTTMPGVQNLLVLAFFSLMVLISASTASADFDGSFRLLNAIAVLGGLVAGAAYVSLAFVYPRWAEVLSPRSVAAFLVLCLAWTAAHWMEGEVRYAIVSVIYVAVIAFTLSRTATVVALLLACAALAGPSHSRGTVARVLRIVGAMLLAVGALAVLVKGFPSFGSRFETGDVISLGGSLRLNVMGRDELWGATWRSALTHPWFGGGPGSAQVLVTGFAPAVEHPHNDYLRVFHDYGLVGLTAWMALLLRSARLSQRRLSSARRARAVQRAATRASLLATAAMALIMVTDNVVTYPFIMGPFGALLGMAASQSDVRRPLAAAEPPRLGGT